MSNNVSFENQPSLSELVNAKKAELPLAISNELSNIYSALKKLVAQLEYGESLIVSVYEEDFALHITLGIETNVFLEYPKYKYFQPYLGIAKAQEIFRVELENFFIKQGFSKTSDPYYDKSYYILK